MHIQILDEFSPEDTAMMQALYSRSAESVTKHIEKVKKTSSNSFMQKFYVQYNHQSIGDCGSTTIFIEDISILAAKAIQDWPLYRGQETSTRYIDMSKQKLQDPVGSAESAVILAEWMNFYLSSQEELTCHLKKKYSIKSGEKPEIYEKAIKARVFDVLRSFLPAGIHTQLSWHTDLRQAADKLFLLRYHPLNEVKEIAAQILAQLKSKYPSSFSHKEYSATEFYRQKCAQHTYWEFQNNRTSTDQMGFSTTVKNSELSQFDNLLTTRPVKTNLPTFISSLGQCNFQFLLDFGSFRDIQRHRNGSCKMPLLTTKKGFHKWYLEEMPESLKIKAKELIQQQTSRINKLQCSKEELQYYIAMGYLVDYDVSYGLPAAVYVAELRSGKTVHPTLRPVAQSMGHLLKHEFPRLAVHIDSDLDDWDIRRGNQDIIEKK